MTIELIFDLSVVDSQHNKEKTVDDGEESSTESTYYSDEDCKALEAFFDDDSSMCSSSSEESMASYEYDGTYKRTFGDEDSLVLAKGRYPEEELEEEQEQDAAPVPLLSSAAPLSSSSRADDILLQAESLLDDLSLGSSSSCSRPKVIYTPGPALRLTLNRNQLPPRGNAIDLQKGRPPTMILPGMLNRNNRIVESEL